MSLYIVFCKAEATALQATNAAALSIQAKKGWLYTPSNLRRAISVNKLPLLQPYNRNPTDVQISAFSSSPATQLPFT
jgi:hypothetical protein